MKKRAANLRFCSMKFSIFSTEIRMEQLKTIFRWKRWRPADRDSSSHHCSCGCCCAFSQVFSIFSQPLSDSFGVDTAWAICRQHKEDVKLPISTSKQSSCSKWRAKEAWLLELSQANRKESPNSWEEKSGLGLVAAGFPAVFSCISHFGICHQTNWLG